MKLFKEKVQKKGCGTHKKIKKDTSKSVSINCHREEVRVVDILKNRPISIKFI